MARPDTTIGNDPEYLRRLAKVADGKKMHLHAARLLDIAYKLEQLERCALKGLVSYMRELEGKTHG